MSKRLDSDLSISSTTPDWSREVPRQCFNPSRKLLHAIRRYQAWNCRRGMIAAFVKRIWVLHHRFWSVVSAADIPINCQLEGGLLLTHPSGVVVHPDAQIGPNCLLEPHVTIGTGGRTPGVPVLEGHVDIGAGACVLGGIRVGEHSVIGANAVVLQDIPPWSLAVGVPARILDRRN